MHDVLSPVTRLDPDVGDAVAAVVIGLDGGSSRRLGSRMWISRDGRRFGSLTVGGCADRRAVEEAVSVFADGHARRIRVDLGEEGPDFGMSCAGAVDVFLERVQFGGQESDGRASIEAVQRGLDAGRRVVWVTELSSLPAHFVLREDQADRHGLPDDVFAAARALSGADEERCVLIEGLDRRPPFLLQSFRPLPLLVVVGTGPTAAPLVQIAKMIGFRVILVDARMGEARKDEYPDADEIICGIPSEVCRALPLDESSFVAVVAHDYKYEVPVLREVLRRGVRYVGFVAGRRRGSAVLEFLERTGVGPDILEQVRVPIGLDLGADRPAEIAVSIAAEMLAVRHERSARPLRGGLAADMSRDISWPEEVDLSELPDR